MPSAAVRGPLHCRRHAGRCLASHKSYRPCGDQSNDDRRGGRDRPRRCLSGALIA